MNVDMIRVVKYTKHCLQFDAYSTVTSLHITYSMGCIKSKCMANSAVCYKLPTQAILLHNYNLFWYRYEFTSPLAVRVEVF